MESEGEEDRKDTLQPPDGPPEPGSLVTEAAWDPLASAEAREAT